ncbi:MAG TPA: hypothetical protein VIX73_12385 [Kofleriaceae bacterium]|jgi:hypothetical protein
MRFPPPPLADQTVLFLRRLASMQQDALAIVKPDADARLAERGLLDDEGDVH